MDKPNVLTLSVTEWKALALQRIAHLADGIATISDHLQKQSVIHKPMIVEMNAYWGKVMGDMAVGWDHVQLPLQGWEKNSRPLIAEYEAQQMQQKEAELNAAMAAEYPNDATHRQQALAADLVATVSHLNPATEAIVKKRKGGWVKGRPRKPKAPASSADVLPPVTQ